MEFYVADNKEAKGMDIKERMMKVLMANPETLKKIDDVLLGKDKPARIDLSREFRLVSFTDAAKMLNVSRPTVYRMAKCGTLDLITTNGMNRTTMKSVMEVALGMRNDSKSTRGSSVRDAD